MTRWTKRAAIAMALAVPGLALADAAQADPLVQTVPGFADFLAVDGQTVWATNQGRVEQWSRDGKLGEVALAHPCGGMAVLDGGLWVADCKAGSVNRIDLASRKLTMSVATGMPYPTGEMNVVTGAGSVWVASDPKGVVARIDPVTGTVVARVAVSANVSYMAFGFGAVWAVSLPQRTVQRIDPATNAVTATTTLGKDPGFLVAGEGAVWIQEQGDGTLVRVDPVSAAVTGRIKVGANLKWGDIDAGGGKVWLRTTDDQVFAVIDPQTLAIRARIGKAAGSGALRYTPAGIWSTAHDEHTLTWWPNPDSIGG